MLTNHYKTVSSDENLHPIFLNIKTAQDPIIEQELHQNSSLDPELNKGCLNRNFVMSELRTALNKKKSTAPGADQIHYDILKQLPNESMDTLLSLINSSWEQGTLPDSWKEATIIPILKPKKDSSLPASYRPISLTSALCKVMETMVTARLKFHLERKNSIGITQSGFRNHRSTIDQLARLETVIKNAFIGKGRKRQHVLAVFLDLEKAFDLMWTKGAIRQLIKKGIRNRMLVWIDNFLTGRKIRVRVGAEHAEHEIIDNGSPQGSVISPILFNVMIDTLYETLSQVGPDNPDDRVDLSQFADDSSIWHVHHDINVSHRVMQNALNKISIWQNEWGFKISPLKTEAVIFNRTHNTLKYLETEQQYVLKISEDKYRRIPHLTVNNQAIPYKKQARFLGMILDYKLTWSPHVKDLINRCRKDLNLMKLISGTCYGADKKALLMVYKALILSKIDYGCILYHNAAKSILAKLDVIQNTALKIATGAYKATRTAALEAETTVKPLKLRREEHTLKYWARSQPHGNRLPLNKLYRINTTNNLAQAANQASKRPISHFVLNAQSLLRETGLEGCKIQPYQTYIPYYTNEIEGSLELHHTIPNKKVDPTGCLVQANKIINKKWSKHFQIYTDGSKNPETGSTAAAFHIPEVNYTRQFKLNPNLTVFTSELIAIEKALEFNLLQTVYKQTVILTDSMSAIQALNSGQSKTRPDKIHKIKQLISITIKKGKEINIEWVPSHVGIPGNERADAAATAAHIEGESDITLPTPKEIYAVINEKSKLKWQKQWLEVPQSNFLRCNCHQLPAKCEMYHKDRRADKIITRLRLGKNGIKTNLINTGAIIDIDCFNCDEGVAEHPWHYFFECDAFIFEREELRATCIKHGIIADPYHLIFPPKDAQGEVYQAILNYVKATGYWEKI